MAESNSLQLPGQSPMQGKSNVIWTFQHEILVFKNFGQKRDILGPQNILVKKIASQKQCPHTEPDKPRSQQDKPDDS